jgi:hypothetical protein
MAIAFSRNALPAEFFDLTSPRMLKQPEPAYLFAGLFYMAETVAQLKEAGMTFGVGSPITDAGDGRGVPNHGAPIPQFVTNQLKFNEADMVASEAIMVDNTLSGTGQGVIGHTLRFNRPAFINSTYTIASRTISSSTAISTTGTTLQAEQVNATIQLVGGPYDNTLAAVTPYPIFNFDAMRSVHSAADEVSLQLVRDRMRYVDTYGGLYFTLGSITVFPGDPNNTQTTAAGACLTQGDRQLDLETLWRAEEQLDGANWPRFSDGTYYYVGSPRQIRQLKNDNNYNKQAVFIDKQFNFLSNSYVAQIGKIKIFETTTLPTTTVNSTVVVQEGALFGPNILGYVPGWQCHVRSFNEDNAGLTPKVMWVAGEGSTLLDNRGIINVLSD